MVGWSELIGLFAKLDLLAGDSSRGLYMLCTCTKERKKEWERKERKSTKQEDRWGEESVVCTVLSNMMNR